MTTLASVLALLLACAPAMAQTRPYAGQEARPIETLNATPRAEHLKTHLEPTALLSPQQVARCQPLRGYDNAAGHGNPSHPR